MTKDTYRAHGLTHTVLALLLMILLIAGSFWVLHPFLTAMIWAVMIVVATWPFMIRIQSMLWNKRILAVGIMTLLLLMILIVPFTLAVLTVVSSSEDILLWLRSISTASLPMPPDWLGTVPGVGKKMVEKWQNIIAIGPAGISAFLTPYAGKILSWLAAMSGSIGVMIIQFLLTVFMAAILYLHGDKAATWLALFARRIAGHFGEHSLVLAAGAIRAVALGVVGTAIIQALLGWVGLAVCGIPSLGILTALIFISCLAQLGPVAILAPVVIWLFWDGQTAWGTALAAWALFLGSIDNIIRPLLMKQGADLPLLLVFAGVTGGMMVFGIIGLFIGPVVLAVSYTLLDAWVTGDILAGTDSCGGKELSDTEE
ncbi:MAG: AI-2E family transporter YdiK [Desulfuromonadaceae bacterium]|nr:AI-2E family transporter YdiK [Desulfuromonadaceae bacterium]MDD5104612.1 AI-2E family transporter YdiK [Desulfuromonadaceae bacterium]